MAQSPSDEANQRAVDRYASNWSRMTQFIREGKSWSGNERHCCFLNTGDGAFADVCGVSGVDFAEDGRALALIDWDRDGDLDIWATNRTGPRLRFLRNEAPESSGFVSFKLVGRDSNRDAIGARVELFMEDATPSRQIRSLRAGEGFLGQSTKTILFGLGSGKTISKVVVRWPAGGVQEFENLPPNTHYRIEEGRQPERLWQGRRARADAIAPAELHEPLPDPQSRVVLEPRRRMPPIRYHDTTNAVQVLDGQQRHPLLINLWSSSCVPCVTEMSEFTEHAETLRDAGVHVVAINVDQIDATWESNQSAQEVVHYTRFPFDVGTANQQTPELFDKRHLFERLDPYPLPSSFLFDEEHRLAVVYLGPVSVDQLIKDVTWLPDADRLADSALPFSGKWISDVYTLAPPAVQEAEPERASAIIYVIAALAILLFFSLKLRKTHNPTG